jgi:triphosphoribosyl-dephospho-CoA synthetase
MLKYAVADAFSAALIIEAAAPGKLSTVSGTEEIKDLNLTKFTLSAPAVRDVVIRSVNNALRGKPISLGKLVLHGIRKIMRNPLVRTNTALGYLMLSVPLSYTLGLALRESKGDLKDMNAIITRYYSIIEEQLKKENIKHFYTAVRTAGEGHLGKFVGAVPSVKDNVTSAKVSVWDALMCSAYYDVIAYDITHGFHITLLALNKLLVLAKKPAELLKAIPYLQAYILSKMPDTLVLKAWGLPTALLLSSVASSIRPGTSEWHAVSKELRNAGVNPGSTSDIMSAAIALYLVSHIVHSSSS